MNKNIFKFGMLALMVLISVALVASPAAADPVMTRTLSDSTIAPGDTVHVTLELTGYVDEQSFNSLQEDYSAAEMAGWTVSNVELPPELDAYVITAGVVHYFSRDMDSGKMPAGDYTVEYDLTVDASTSPAVYDLTGKYLDSGNSAGFPAVGDTQLTVNIPLPVADFESDVISGSVPLTVQFTDNSINADAWEWDFDNDGSVDSTEQSPEYIFTTQGIYTVSLNISNDFGEDSVTKTDLITVTNVPTELFNGEVYLLSADMNDEAALAATGLSYTQSGGMINSIGGHTYEPMTGPGTGSTWYTFINGEQTASAFSFGSYAVADGDNIEFILMGMDDMGPNPIDQQYVVSITVNAAPLPVADFDSDIIESNVISGYIPLTVQFTDNSSNADAWEWDFDEDGDVDSFEQNPTWVYDTAGIYNVSLNVTNEYAEDNVTKIDMITVATVPTELFNGDVTLDLSSAKTDQDALNTTGLNYTKSMFLDSIEGYENVWDPTGAGWAILLNGEMAGVFGTNAVVAGDVVELIYVGMDDDTMFDFIDSQYIVRMNIKELSSSSSSSSSGGHGGGTGSARIASSVETPVPPVVKEEPVADNNNDGDSAGQVSDDSGSQGEAEYQEPKPLESDPDTPGFEMIFAVIGLLMSVYLAKRH